MGRRIIPDRIEVSLAAGTTSRRRRLSKERGAQAGVAMHIVMGLVVGMTLGVLAGSVAAQYVAPVRTIAVPANKAPVEIALPQARSWDI
jgi:hypothetical protein